MNNDRQEFTSEQTQLYVDLRRLIDGFRYKDSSGKRNGLLETAGDSAGIELGFKTQYLYSHSPESKILENWYEYLSAVLVEREPKDLRDAVKNTKAERRDYLETLEFFMQRKPNGEDLKELLNLPDKFDALVKDINDDIKNLL